MLQLHEERVHHSPEVTVCRLQLLQAHPQATPPGGRGGGGGKGGRGGAEVKVLFAAGLAGGGCFEDAAALGHRPELVEPVVLRGEGAAGAGPGGGPVGWRLEVQSDLLAAVDLKVALNYPQLVQQPE